MLYFDLLLVRGDSEKIGFEILIREYEEKKTVILSNSFKNIEFNL